jgi:Na+/H+ antiporter NhaD/arsenite permease-like protein
LNPLAAIIFGTTIAAVIARQLLFRGPPVWVVFLAGAFAMVASGVLPLSGASLALSTNLPVLVFLFSLFVLAAGLEQAGALDHVASWVLGRARSPADLPLVLFVALGLLSAFIVNDALVLVGVPLLFALSRRMQVSALPLLLTLAYSVSIGSALTPFGNPQNLLVSLGSGMPTPISTFLRYLLLPTVVNLAIGGFYLRRVFGPGLAREGERTGIPPRIPLLPQGNWGTLVQRFPTVLVFPVTIVAMITLDVTSAVAQGPTVPLYVIALGGAVVALVATPGRAALFARVDWSILVLFGSLFVVVAGVVSGGVLSALVSLLPIPGPNQPAALAVILVTSLGGSQLVSNVPWVGLQIPLMHAVGYGTGTPWAWVALAAGSTLAGNVTLLGAASNLIVVEQAERAGVRVGLREFVRVGAPLAALTTLVLFAFLWAGL